MDDIAQGITEIVRGADLLDSTPRQLYLYQCLNALPPNYLHLPLALQKDGKKLSKQTGALALDNRNAAANLIKALEFLGQNPPQDLLSLPVEGIITWSVKNWDISNIAAQDFAV